jgi:hypothetical protein
MGQDGQVSTYSKFDETTGLVSLTNFREDIDYSGRAIRAGFNVLYLPEIQVFHQSIRPRIGGNG